jgi:hypothetical protein
MFVVRLSENPIKTTYLWDLWEKYNIIHMSNMLISGYEYEIYRWPR